MKNKKAAMELTMGTIVTIVLLVAMLIVGIYFINKIRETGTNAIDGIDQSIRNEINKLFTDDDSRSVVVYPPSREIMIKKGEDSLGFGFAIRNLGQDAAQFSYDVTATEVSCSSMRLSDAEGLITLGKQGRNIQISAGSIMENPIFVRFGIPETTPPCQVRYAIDLKKGTEVYGSTVSVDLTIKPQ